MDEHYKARSSIKDVAVLADVSTATVSHVINGTRYVSEELRQRVLKAMDEANYHPNLLAKGLRGNSTFTIGLIIPDVSNAYYTSVAEAVERQLKIHGYHMILSNSYDSDETENEIVKLYNSLQVDGVVMVPAIGSQGYLEKLVQNQYPFVFVDRRPWDFVDDCVILENTKSTHDAICYLIEEKGYSDIYLVTGDRRLSTTEDRVKGYQEAIREHQMPLKEENILYGDFSYESGKEMARIVAKKKGRRAVFFSNEMMAIGALSFFSANHIRIPEDIGIICCNDFRWTEITNPPMTTISQPTSEMGQKAADLLIRKIEDKKKGVEPSETSCIKISTQIIVRESC